MTRRRWIADESSGDHAALVGEHADHLIRALRVRLGQEFDISTGKDVRRGRVSSIANGRVEFELEEEVVAAKVARITLVLAIFKFDRMEWAIEKCTELGVARIVPLIVQRTEVHLAKAAEKRTERWRRIALQAAEQSRRDTPPEIMSPVRLKEAMAAAQSGLRIVLSESEQRQPLRDVLESHPSGEIVLAIGPEGGWTSAELPQFQKAGWQSASLGPTILRAETAAIAAAAIAISENL
jgi:16S rRNA (uracil1498-N3)-methyltransferase